MVKRKNHSVSAELQEELTQKTLQIEGKIPAWLEGTLIRNGPIPVHVNGRSNTHWLDGLAMLHAFSFKNESVIYSNRFLRTDAYKKVFDEGSLCYEGFASDPCRSLFKRLFTLFIPTIGEKLHNANINVAKLADQYVAFTEIPLPVQFDPQTLETLGVFDYQDKLPKNRCWESAHPHYDLQRKEAINYLIEYGKESFYTVYRIKDGSSEREIIARIPVKEPSYMHSFAVTANYIILTEYPLVVRPLDFIIKGKPFIENFIWEPQRGTQFTVMNRLDGELMGTYKTKPFFAFHHANAFEEGDLIFLDVVTYLDAGIIEAISEHYSEMKEKSGLENDFPMRLERFMLSLKTGELTSEILFDQKNEFPRINPAYDGRPYRYVYLVDPRDPIESSEIRSIYKYSTTTKQTWQWSEEHCYPGEPVFVASPNAAEEDDGVVLSVVLDLKNNSSFLLILEAKGFKEIARSRVPHLIPYGLHGQYFTRS